MKVKKAKIMTMKTTKMKVLNSDALSNVSIFFGNIRGFPPPLTVFAFHADCVIRGDIKPSTRLG